MSLFREKSDVIKKITWYVIITISTAGLLFFISGFVMVINVNHNAKMKLNEKNIGEKKNGLGASEFFRKNKNAVTVGVIGDSIAKGTGDEKGKGFSGYLPEYFKNQTPKDISVNNAAIDGLRVSGLREQLQSGKIDRLITGSDYVVISIGGNDARTVLQVKGISREDEFSGILDAYLASLKESIKIVRRLNPECIVIFIGLYNPYQENGYENNRLLNEWNYKTEALLNEDNKTLFIATYSIFKLNVERFIAADGLHPNSAGYQAVSGMISKSVEEILVKGK
jgi:lysophospholipase L1-like esterase